MPKAEFLQLAHKYEPKKHRIAGWFASEKADGLRVFWDGGITRGMPTSMVPWANTFSDDRYLVKPIATGLWTRYGKTIQAPDWFLNQLPNFPLDGELWAGRGNFQTVSSIVKQLIPDARWKAVKFLIFDLPSYREFCVDRTLDFRIGNKVHKKVVSGALDFVIKHLRDSGNKPLSFQSVVHLLPDLITQTDNLIIHEQVCLPYTTDDAHRVLAELVEKVVSGGGEGVMLRSAMHHWTPARVHHLLKVKPYQDDEGIVTGYVWGRETDFGSKLLGMMGALILHYKGKQFELSGFTDGERQLFWNQGIKTAEDWGKTILREGTENQGKEVRGEIHNPKFPRGSKVTFRYRELTDSGLPKEARYWRKHEDS